MITDAQIHIWETSRLERPWPGVPVRPPHKPNGFAADQLLAEMNSAGVDRAILVPPSWVGDMNETALEAAARYPARLAVIGRFNPKSPTAEQRLSGWLKQPHMLGIRMTFHTKPSIDWLQDGSLDWYWKACEEMEIPTMALVPGMAGKLLPILERHNQLKIVIPHMGCFLDAKTSEAFAALDQLLALAHYPRVVVMISSAPNYSREPYPFRDIEPYIRRIFDAFGPKRMLWGSDITRLTSTYRECLDHAAKSLDFLSSEDKTWVLGRSLAEALNWPEEV